MVAVKATFRLSLLLLLHALVCARVQADEDEQAQRVELETLRAQVADQVQLTAFDMLDDLVFEWTQSPPFDEATPVFVADVSVPIGLGTALSSLLENHLAALLLANPSTNVVLSHCPSCQALVVHSGKDGTVVSRGLDNPEVLKRIGGAGGKHGLHIDFAAEGAWLVLRARITKLTPDLPIVWSRTLTSAAGKASLLRSPIALKSAEDARNEYLDALHGRGLFDLTLRFNVRSYSAGSSGIPPPPIVWLQTGAELSLTHAHAWLASTVLGISWLPEAYLGLMLETRISRLISGRTRSLTHPDVYLFFGGTVTTLNGPAIGPFRTENSDQIRREATSLTDTRATFGALHLGLEVRLGNRLGAGLFLENMPYYQTDGRIGEMLDLGIVELHSLGVEVSVWF